MAAHMDVNALVTESLGELDKPLALACVDNLKRNITYQHAVPQGLQYITALQEVKTTWHPIEQIGGASSSY
jgi:hypothetical protein